MIQSYLWVGIGSALGGMARYGCGAVAARWLGIGFPWGTLAVNVLGCALIGFFAAITGPEGRLMAGTTVRQFVMVGLCGGFTTFSTFGLETLNLARDGQWARALANIAISLFLCLAAVWTGWAAATGLNER